MSWIHTTPRLRTPEPHRWRLRTYLVAPVVLVALAVALSHANIELSIRAQTETLVAQRGSTVLGGIEQQLTERERAMQVYAQLLADQSGVVLNTDGADKIGLAQVLLPQKAKLDLERIAIQLPGGQELIRLGPANEATVIEPLVTQAMAGITRSSITVSIDGLTVLAATPVKGPGGIVGALVVGRTLGVDELRSISARDGVEFALYRGGNLVRTTTDDPDLLGAVAASPPAVDQVGQLNATLGRLHFQSVAKPLGVDGVLLALVPTADLDAASQQRTLVVVGGVAALVVVLLFAVLFLARNIARPLESMVAATAKMVHGDFAQRVTPSAIVELHDLAGAVNYLAEQVQLQLAKLTHQAFHDTLSNLPNRAFCLERLERALANATPESLAVLFVDLDNFKFANDSLGHEAGDGLLVAVAERLQKCMRPGDTLARLGGDEFTILLERINSVADAVGVADRIAAALRAPFGGGGQDVFITASMGVALNGPLMKKPSDLLRAADIAMYRAKANGKGRCEVFDGGMAAAAMERLELETDLRRAVERGEFRVHYQPIVQLATGLITEAEALVRWEHPQHGLVPPLRFIPLAEETGLIVPIGQWILEEACRQTRAWHAQWPARPPLVMSVNLSARQFQQTDLLQVITDALQHSGLAARYLKLEITESVAMRDAQSTIETLRELTHLGVRLAIDDFGTGYSSLAYLNQFPIDTLKIDRSFVDKLADGPEHVAVVRTIVALAKALDLRVTGEGIETAEQALQLEALGCDLGQGYLFSKPQPHEAFSALLAKSAWSLSDVRSAA